MLLCFNFKVKLMIKMDSKMIVDLVTLDKRGGVPDEVVGRNPCPTFKIKD